MCCGQKLDEINGYRGMIINPLGGILHMFWPWHTVVEYMGWLYGFITVNMVPYGWFIMVYLKIWYHMDLRTVPYGYVALISSNFGGTDAIEDQVKHRNPPFSGPSHIQIHSAVNVYWKSTMTVDYFPRFHTGLRHGWLFSTSTLIVFHIANGKSIVDHSSISKLYTSIYRVDFPACHVWLPEGISMYIPWFPYYIPIISLWFPYDIPMISLLSPYWNMIKSI